MKRLEFGVYYGLLDGGVFKLRDLTARRTNQVMMSFHIVRTFVLRGIAKLVLNDQPGVNEKND